MRKYTLTENIMSAALAILIVLAVFGVRFICTYADEEPEPATKVVIVPSATSYISEKSRKESIEAVVEEKAPVEEVKEEFNTYAEIPLPEYLQLYSQELCKEYEVSFPFFLAICESESNFNTEAVGDHGRSLGLMQINKVNWEKYDLDASMVYDNLEIGIRMLSELIEKYGDLDTVIMAYKGGEAKAAQWKEEGYRLPACDTVADRTLYWADVVEN